MIEDKGTRTRKEVTLDSGARVLVVTVRTSVQKVELTGLAGAERRDREG